MGDSQPYVTMCMDSMGRVLYINDENKSSSAAPLGYQVRIPINPVAWNAMVYQERKETVEVVNLPPSHTLPTPLIATWPSGQVEQYASSIGFRYETTIPPVLTASVLLDLRPGSLKAFNFLVGGPVSTPNIPFQKLLGLEGRTAGGPESTFSVKIDPAEITFVPNRAITEFVPIAEYFRGSLSSPGVAMNWAEGAGVYVRFRIAVEQCPTTAVFSTTLVLEAAVFEEGYTWHSQAAPRKTAMEKSSSSAIPLWESQMTWHKPISAFSLISTPGINYFSTDNVACSDTQLRWAMSWVLNECRKGGSISSATEWAEYLKACSPTYATTSPRHGFVINFAHDPVFSTQNSEISSQPTPSSRMPGMPGPVTEERLRTSIQAAATNIAGMRHQGPPHEQSQFSILGQPGTFATVSTLHTSPIGGIHDDQPPSLSNFQSPNLANYQAPNLTNYQAPNLTNYQAPSAPTPTVYIMYCDKCSWHSIPTTDGAAYGGAVLDLQNHEKKAHPEVKESADFASNFRDSEDFKLATSLRDVEACKDDGVNNFCPVRFWRGPMSWKNSQLALPVSQTPVCGVGDFEPFGLEVSNRKLVKDIHYLGCKSLKLSDFSDVNLRMVPSQQDTFVGLEKGNSGRIYTKKMLKEISSVKESIKAVANYAELMRMIHPLYSGPQILFKVLFEKYLQNVATTENIEKFFSSVIYELASRATRKELPYTYHELITKWDVSYKGLNLGLNLDSSTHDSNQAFDKKLLEASKRLGFTPPNKNNLPPKRPRTQNMWCPLYNTSSGCTNKPRASGGCTDQAGTELKHGCSVKVGGRMCNSNQHNRLTH